MSRVFIPAVLIALAPLISGCGSSTNTNANANQVVVNANVDANNLPPGLSTVPIEPSANTTPGIPAANAVNNVPKGATPTPGIPDPAELKKPFKPGATPTPGIPSPEEIRRQLQRNTSNVNVNAGGATDAGEQMMRSRKSPRPVNKP